MTVTSQTSKVIYTGTGATDTFAYTFRIFKADNLTVTKITIADGSEETLVLNSDYTVSGVGEQSGGDVVLLAGNLSSDYQLVIQRVLDITQETDYEESDSFPAETHEAALDRLTMICQQLQEQIGRSMLQAITQTTQLTFPSPEASTYIGWNAAGDALRNYTPEEAVAAQVLAQFIADYLATQAEAEAGVENTHYMTPLRTKQAIDAATLFDAAPSAGTVSGEKVTLTAGENLAAFDLCYIKSDGKAWKADADATTTMPGIFMATDTISADAEGTFLQKGYATNSGWSWTVGGLVYASGTAGAVTQTAPSGSGDQVQVVGVAMAATTLFFNPSLVLAEVA